MRLLHHRFPLSQLLHCDATYIHIGRLFAPDCSSVYVWRGVAVTLQGPRAAYEHQPAEGRLLVWTQERGALRIHVRPAP